MKPNHHVPGAVISYSVSMIWMSELRCAVPMAPRGGEAERWALRLCSLGCNTHT